MIAGAWLSGRHSVCSSREADQYHLLTRFQVHLSFCTASPPLPVFSYLMYPVGRRYIYNIGEFEASDRLQSKMRECIEGIESQTTYSRAEQRGTRHGMDNLTAKRHDVITAHGGREDEKSPVLKRGRPRKEGRTHPEGTFCTRHDSPANSWDP